MSFKLEECPQLNHAAGTQTLKPMLEEAWKGANPIDPGTQAASETPGEMLEATVPKITESRKLPIAQGH